MAEEHQPKHAHTEHKTAAPPAETNTPQAAAPAAASAKKSNKTLWIVLGLVAFFVIIVPAILFTASVFFIRNRINDTSLTEKSIESALERASGGNVDVDSKSGNFSVSNDQGETLGFGSNQEIPEDFPKDKIPYIKEKDVTFVMTNTSDGKKSWSVTTSVSDSYEKAKSYFESKIVEPDFESVSSYGFGDSQTYSGTNSTLSVSVTISEGTSGAPTSVTYYVSEL